MTSILSLVVHLETAASLTTDSFLNPYRCSIGHRGPVRQLRSDQGTNFVGTSNELKAALTEMNQDMVNKEMAGNSCDWIHFDVFKSQYYLFHLDSYLWIIMSSNPSRKFILHLLKKGELRWAFSEQAKDVAELVRKQKSEEAFGAQLSKEQVLKTSLTSLIIKST